MGLRDNLFGNITQVTGTERFLYKIFSHKNKYHNILPCLGALLTLKTRTPEVSFWAKVQTAPPITEARLTTSTASSAGHNKSVSLKHRSPLLTEIHQHYQ
jgi:hypothetical protein